MMTRLRIWLAVPFVTLSIAHATSAPRVLVDFTRYEAPFGVTEIPPDLARLIPLPNDRMAFSWVLFSPDAEVKVGVTETEPHRVGNLAILRQMVLELPSFAAYRELVGERSDLDVSAESLEVLRGRRHEVGLDSRGSAGDHDHAARPVVLEDYRVKAEIPGDAITRSIKARMVESNPEGGVRLSLSGLREGGEPFARSVVFEDLDDFNRASGENVTAAEFNRRTLLFWADSGESKMGGRFVMKTRAEIHQHCADLLRIGVSVSPGKKPAPEGPNAGGGN